MAQQAMKYLRIYKLRRTSEVYVLHRERNVWETKERAKEEKIEVEELMAEVVTMSVNGLGSDAEDVHLCVSELA